MLATMMSSLLHLQHPHLTLAVALQRLTLPFEPDVQLEERTVHQYRPSCMQLDLQLWSCLPVLSWRPLWGALGLQWQH